MPDVNSRAPKLSIIFIYLIPLFLTIYYYFVIFMLAVLIYNYILTHYNYFYKAIMGIEFFTLFMISLGLSMDAFAVSVTDGLCYNKIGSRYAFFIALTFGVFQGAMAIIGFFIGSAIGNSISAIGHIIAFIILAAIGIKMIVEAVTEKDKKECLTDLKFGQLMVQGVATSIDSLAVGFGFAAFALNIWYTSFTIGIITFAVCFVGVLIGKKFGGVLKKNAVITGGIILILIGLKILLENII